MTPKKATIIGARGFIGSHLHSRLQDLGWDCSAPKKNEINNKQEDLGHLFYCAGLTADFAQRPFDTVEAHVSLLSRILQKCKFQSLTYLSSTRLYDGKQEDVGSEEDPLTLNPGTPRHLFDLSKALGESLCLVMGHGRARVARVSCVYNDHKDLDGFLPGLINQIITKKKSSITIDSSPYFSRDYVQLDDVIDALILIATRGTDFIYNVASGENISNELLFSTLSEISGCSIHTLSQDIPAFTPCRISISKMNKEFNWRPVPVLKNLTRILKENSA